MPHDGKTRLEWSEVAGVSCAAVDVVAVLDRIILVARAEIAYAEGCLKGYLVRYAE